MTHPHQSVPASPDVLPAWHAIAAPCYKSPDSGNRYQRREMSPATFGFAKFRRQQRQQLCSKDFWLDRLVRTRSRQPLGVEQSHRHPSQDSQERFDTVGSLHLAVLGPSSSLERFVIFFHAPTLSIDAYHSPHLHPGVARQRSQQQPVQGLDAWWSIHLAHFYCVQLEIRSLALQSPGPIQAYGYRAHFQLRRAGGSSSASAHFQVQMAQHRRLGHFHFEMSLALTQDPVVKTSNDKIGPLALAPLDGFVEVRLAIGNINPRAACRRSAFLQSQSPALRFARAAHQLAACFPSAVGLKPAAPTLLGQQSQRNDPRPLLQIPPLDAQGQG